MKKLVALLLTMTLLLSMTACRRKQNTKPTDTGNTQPPSTTTQEDKASLPGTMEENVNKLMQANPVQFMGGLIPVNLQDTSEEGLWELKSFTGLDSAEKLTDLAVYEPVTGAQAFSLVLVRVASAADAKPIAQQMKDNINPRKWICVEADQVMAAGYGDTVMFIMLESSLDMTAQSYVDAFATLCGGKLDFTI